MKHTRQLIRSEIKRLTPYLKLAHALANSNVRGDKRLMAQKSEKDILRTINELETALKRLKTI